MIIILMTQEVSFVLLENIYSTGVTHDDCHDIFIVQATGDSEIIRMMPSCGITYDCHSDDSRGVI
jgi:hypothetical protein